VRAPLETSRKIERALRTAAKAALAIGESEDRGCEVWTLENRIRCDSLSTFGST
jgi:hypothetical protein